MEAVERFLEENVRNDSNIVIGYYPNGIQQYYPWIPLRQARKIGELAREETIKEVCEWIENNVAGYCVINDTYDVDGCIKDLKKHLGGKK